MKSMIPSKINWQGLSSLNFSALLSQTARYRTGAILTVITILTYQSAGIFYKAVSWPSSRRTFLRRSGRRL